jgi:phage host-nuclease inhibitor protein Gam
MIKKTFCFIIFSFFLFSCNKEKLAEQERTIELQKNNIEQLNIQITFLKTEIENLKSEIVTLKETDQFYYQSGADEFTKGNFKQTIDWMNRLKLRFPNSTILVNADRMIRDSNTQITVIYERERTNLNQLIREVRNVDIEVAIERLEVYIREDHPNDLKDIAKNSLNQYKADFEKIRTEREIEQIFGVRLTDYSTGWNEYTSFGQTLFQPNVALKFQNISGRNLPTKSMGSFGIETTNTIEIKVEFVETSKNEIFGDGSSYLVGYGDNLGAGISKTAYVRSSVGYTRTWASYELNNLPIITAKVYINDRLYKSFNIRKGYRISG